MKTSHTGQTIKEQWFDWQGRPLSAERIAEHQAQMPRCSVCGESVNSAGKVIRQDAQSITEIRLLLGTATHVLTSGGLLPVDCWIEHVVRPFADIVQYERVGDRLFERPYPDDRSGGILGIWGLVNKEYQA